MKFLNNGRSQSENKQLDEKISNIFISIGIPAHIKGYQFLREAVKLAVEEPEIIGSITKNFIQPLQKDLKRVLARLKEA